MSATRAAKRRRVVGERKKIKKWSAPKLKLQDLQPLDVLALICGFLDVRAHARFARVCVSFRDASCRRGAWPPNVDFHSFGLAVSDGVLQRHFCEQRPTGVDLSLCHEVTARGLSAFRSCPLRALSLANICEKNNVVSGILDLDVSQLLVLDVSRNGHCVNDQVLNFITGHCRQLRTLYLNGTSAKVDVLSAAAFARVSALKQLELLDLSSCAFVTNATLAPLRHLSALRSLRLYDTDIDSEGLAHIAHLKLCSLNLSHTSVDNQAVDLLVQCTSLTELHLSQTNVTSVGLEDLLKHLCSKLRILTIGGEAVTDRLLTGVPLQLKELRLCWCDKFTDDGLHELAASPLKATLTALTLDNCALTVDGLRHLAWFTRLRRLAVVDFSSDGSSLMTGGALKQIATVKTLQKLSFKIVTGFGKVALRHLSALSVLKELHLSGSLSLTDRDFADLQPLLLLQHLSLAQCVKLTDAAMSTVAANCPRLRRLNLYNTRVSRRGLRALKDMPHLSHVVLDRNKLTSRLDLANIDCDKDSTHV